MFIILSLVLSFSKHVSFFLSIQEDVFLALDRCTDWVVIHERKSTYESALNLSSAAYGFVAFHML